jgi:hypothetical protein
MVTSYKQLIKFVDDFASQHQQIQRFRAEFEEQMPNFATENEAYPILFMAPVGSQFFFNQDTYTVRFYCFDIIQKDRANINYILSDTNLILNDLKKWFQEGSNYTFDILGDPTATPINNALLDYAAGWQMDITFNVDTYCVDEIPFKDSPLIPVEGYDVVYSRYLTCETVTGCTTFQEYIANAISNLPTTDIFVTGGTYNSESGIATFTNNSGGTFNVSGFTGGGNVDQYWISGSTGNFSIKANNDSAIDATGDYALAEGYNTNATGRASHAQNIENEARGEGSHAGGFQSRSRGKYSFVHGNGSTANGEGTIVFGNGITGDDDNTVYVPNIQFDLNAPSTMDVGRMEWNDADGTVDLRLKGNNVTLQIGQEQVVRVVNKTGANLLESQYRAVRVRNVAEGGAQGQRLAVVLAQANSTINATDTIGLVTENINNNQEGFVTLLGQVRNINTTGSLQGETWVDGDVLYLSPTTAGGLTKVKPTAPNKSIVIGYVEYAHVNNGKIYVNIQNGYDLDDLNDVSISGTPSNGQWLEYNSSLSAWTNTSAFDFSLNFISDFTYPIILPYNWLVESVDNPSSIGVNLSATTGTYTLGNNISAFTETLTVSASTSGFINLNCRRIN